MPKILSIDFDKIASSLLLGIVLIYSLSGGSDAKASAPRVSIII